MNKSRRRLIGSLAAVTAPALPNWAAAQASYPSKPIRLVHGYGVGTNSDVIGRLVAAGLRDVLGQPVVMDTMPGAAERIAARHVIGRPADGYTLYFMTGGANVVSATDPQAGFDTLKDFSYISTVTQFPFALIVSAASPFRTLGDLLDAAKKNPGKLNYGIPGLGNTLHLSMEYLKARAGVEIEAIAYQGASQQIADTVTGRVDVAVSTLSTFNSTLQAGQARALALTSAQRWPLNREIQTVAEFVPGYEAMSWLGFAAPAGLPAELADRLAEAIRSVMARDDVRRQVHTLQAETRTTTPAAFRSLVEADFNKWKPLARFVKS